MDNLEEKFRKGFSDFESPVTDDQWDRLKGDAARIAKRNRKRNKGGWLIIPFMLIGLVWFSYGMLFNKSSDDQVLASTSTSLEKTAGLKNIEVSSDHFNSVVETLQTSKDNGISTLQVIDSDTKKAEGKENDDSIVAMSLSSINQVPVSSQSFLIESENQHEASFSSTVASSEAASNSATLQTDFLQLKTFDVKEYETLFIKSKEKKSGIYFRKKVPDFWIGIGNTVNSTFATITPSSLDQKLITGIETPSKFDKRRSSLNWSLQFEKKVNSQFGLVGSLGYNRQSFALSYDVFEEVDQAITIVRDPVDNTLKVSQNVLDVRREIEMNSAYFNIQLGGRYYLSERTPRIFFDGRIGANHVRSNDYSDTMFLQNDFQADLGEVNKEFFLSASIATGIQLDLGSRLRFTFGPGFSYQFSERSFYNKEISLKPYDINFNTSIVYKLK